MFSKRWSLVLARFISTVIYPSQSTKSQHAGSVSYLKFETFCHTDFLIQSVITNDSSLYFVSLKNIQFCICVQFVTRKLISHSSIGGGDICASPLNLTSKHTRDKQDLVQQKFKSQLQAKKPETSSTEQTCQCRE